jgi:predicted O-linked N-acetylglucosamine transferase (SPINDLY family)
MILLSTMFEPETDTSGQTASRDSASDGMYEEAKELYDACYHKWVAVLGPDHVDTLSTLHHFTMACSKLQYHAQASTAHEICWGRQTEVLGANHPETLATQNNYALALSKQTHRRQGEAQHLLGQCLRHQTNILGAHHPETINTQANLERLQSAMLARGQKP